MGCLAFWMSVGCKVAAMRSGNEPFSVTGEVFRMNLTITLTGAMVEVSRIFNPFSVSIIARLE